jgi:hypothetical protein
MGFISIIQIRLIDSRLNLLDMKLDRLMRGFTFGPCRLAGLGPWVSTRCCLLTIFATSDDLPNKEAFGPLAIFRSGPFGRTYFSL